MYSNQSGLSDPLCVKLRKVGRWSDRRELVWMQRNLHSNVTGKQKTIWRKARSLLYLMISFIFLTWFRTLSIRRTLCSALLKRARVCSTGTNCNVCHAAALTATMESKNVIVAFFGGRFLSFVENPNVYIGKMIVPSRVSRAFAPLCGLYWCQLTFWSVLGKDGDHLPCSFKCCCCLFMCGSSEVDAVYLFLMTRNASRQGRCVLLDVRQQLINKKTKNVIFNSCKNQF